MINMSDKNDSRIPCQYGLLCYQKNELHMEKYKHLTKKKVEESPKNSSKKKRTTSTDALKQQKLNFPLKNIDQRIEKRNCESSTELVTPISEQIDIAAFADDFDTSNWQSIIKKLFLVNMPEDFYKFWLFCKSFMSENPTEAFYSVGLTLVGPFDILASPLKNYSNLDNTSILRHWRYYYDPPEFQTIIKSNGTDLLHFGYFRDDPDSVPVFVASNCAAKNATITPNAENLFGAMNWYLSRQEKSANLFKKVELAKLKSELGKWAEKYNFTLETSTKNMRTRNTAVVCKTFHGAGIVVPYNCETQLGYRSLSETPDELRKILKRIDDCQSESERIVYFSKLNEIVTWTNIAVDEGDFGTCLELGIDLFCFGSDFVKKIVLQLLTSAYTLLGRQSYITIIKAHLEDRKKGDDLNVFK